MNVKNVYWLAGILEGEGSFCFDSSPSITVAMTDEDVILKVSKLFNRPYYTKTDNGYKTVYAVGIYGASAVGLMFTLYLLMGNRRQSKILEVINKWKLVPVKDKINFPCGHPRRHGYNYCNICSVERTRRYRREKKNAAQSA